MKTMFSRLMEAEGAGGGGGSGEVAYTFAQVDGKDLAPEQVTQLSATAKELGLTPEQATKAQASLMKYNTPAAVAVPEAYKFEQVDGKDLPAELVTELSATAKALGLNQEQAQKFVAHELKERAEADTHMKTQLGKVQQGWRDTLKADTEIGGEKLAANLAASKAALEAFFPEVAKDALKFPFLDHPAVVKGLINIGKKIGPDSDFVRTQGGGSSAADPAKIMFPGMN